MNTPTVELHGSTLPASFDPSDLKDRFDAIVMLTWSDWKTEPRSNRYHYASRFAKTLPVYFVQADMPPMAGPLEATELANVTIVHAGSQYGRPQSLFLETILSELDVKRPLIWVYNVYFSDFILRHTNQLIVYHATEDYMRDPDEMFILGDMAPILTGFKQILPHVDLLVSVAVPVRDNFLKRGGYAGPEILVPNGCDHEFWLSQKAHQYSAPRNGRNVAFYQGGINSRLDYDLLNAVAASMPDWEFWFCGVAAESAEWSELLGKENVRYLGRLSIEKVAAAARSARVGIVPFVDRPLMRISVNLKYYEYVACGLPVVSSPNDALLDRPDIFSVAYTPQEFERAIRDLAPGRTDPELLRHRLASAAEQSYDKKFAEVAATLARTRDALRSRKNTLNLLIICPRDLGQRDHELLTRIKQLSTQRIYYLFSQVIDSDGDLIASLSCDLTWFDAVILHSDLLPKDGIPSHSELGHAIRSYDGPKIVLARDEAVLKARSHVLRHLRIESSLSELNDVGALVRSIDDFVDADVFKRARTELIEVPIQSEQNPETRSDILIHLNDPALTVAPREESRKTPRSSVSLDSEENVTAVSYTHLTLPTIYSV